MFLFKPHLAFKINKWIRLRLQRKKSRWRCVEFVSKASTVLISPDSVEGPSVQHGYNFTETF